MAFDPAAQIVSKDQSSPTSFDGAELANADGVVERSSARARRGAGFGDSESDWLCFHGVLSMLYGLKANFDEYPEHTRVSDGCNANVNTWAGFVGKPGITYRPK
jgi:hypothetical protein